MWKTIWESIWQETSKRVCINIIVLVLTLPGFSLASTAENTESSPSKLNPLKPVPVQPSTQAGYHIFAHAHNDYEHERPLLDALENRFYSVEADFWMVDGEILIAHNQGKTKSDYKGTLQELYLDPLQKRVDENGSVYGDGVPFYLWLDIKDGQDEVRPILHQLLQKYPMVTIFTDHSVKEGPVTVILTGDEKSKKAYVDEYSERRACRDGSYSENDPPADHRWTWVALNWPQTIQWYGDDPIRPEEYEKWVKIVNDIHAKGRKIRFWATPETELFWKTALGIGLDLLNTDRLQILNRYLDSFSLE